MATLNYREEALAAKSLGLKSFISGKACVACGTAIRYTSDAGCVECIKIHSNQRRIRAKTDKHLHEKLKGYGREAKARARQTDEGRQAIYRANKKYVEKNKLKVNAYYAAKRANDPVFKMASWSRSVLRKVLERQNKRKDAKCVEIVGYTGEMLKAHIERQFTRGMSWALVGRGIHIDHIVSVAEMMRNGMTDPCVINALSNLRPMWAKANMLKSDSATHLL